MATSRRTDGYQSFQYIREGSDYKHYDLASEMDRVPRTEVPLTDTEAERVDRLTREFMMVSMHDHPNRFPDDISQTPRYVKDGHISTAYEGLAHSSWDCVFDNLLDGICTIESSSGWKWTEVLHDIGMRLCDIAHQDFVVPATSVADILECRDRGTVAWVASLEGAAPIENELDRLDILYGFGVRSIGVTYNEANQLGSGLREKNDSGLTNFGRRAIKRMNQLGMLVDCSHCGDQTTLDAIAVSEKPIVLSHIGARALWNTNRMAPDNVLQACAEKGGVIGVEAAPHTTLTEKHPSHDIESVMEHFEYIVDLVGVDHVGFGADTTYGDHVGIHQIYSAEFTFEEMDPTPETHTSPDFEHVDYVKGLENPTESSHNIVRWLVKHEYDDDKIEKVMGANALRVLDEVWR
jgi:membrane dipeptidase